MVVVVVSGVGVEYKRTTTTNPWVGPVEILFIITGLRPVKRGTNMRKDDDDKKRIYCASVRGRDIGRRKILPATYKNPLF